MKGKVDRIAVLQENEVVPGEWPALFVLDALHSTSMRLALAAAAAELESTSAASNYFSEQSHTSPTGQIRVVDDQVACRAAPDDLWFRRFLQSWLRGRTHLFAKTEVLAGKPTDDRTDLVQGICYLRHPTLVGQPRRPFADIHPLLGTLYENIQHLKNSLHLAEPSFEALGDAFEDTEASPLLRLSAAKFAGDYALYHGFASQAETLYVQAKERLQAQENVSAHQQMKAVLEAGIAYARAYATNADAAVGFLEEARQRKCTGPETWLTDDALFFHRWRRSLISVRRKPVPSKSALVVFDAYMPEQSSRTWNRAAASILTADVDDSLIEHAVAENVAIELGSIHHVQLVQVSRAILTLVRRPDEVDTAFVDLVKSGGAGTTVEKILKRLPREARRALGRVSPKGLERSRAAMDQLPGERPFRATTLAKLLSHIAEESALEEQQLAAMIPTLIMMASERPQERALGNVNSSKPALQALRHLAEHHPDHLLRLAPEEDLNSLFENMIREGSWEGRVAMEAVDSLASRLPQSQLRRHIIAIVEHLEKEELGKSFWPYSLEAFVLLGADAVVQTLENEIDVRERVVTQMLRFCFAPVRDKNLSAEQSMALWLAERLDIPPPEGERDIVAAQLAAIHEARSSRAPGFARDLVWSLDRIDSKAASSLISGVGAIVDGLRRNPGMSSMSSSTTAIVIFELAREMGKRDLLVTESNRPLADSLLEKAMDLVSNSAENPALMCPFDFARPDPVRPGPTIAFNWGYAILGLSAALNQLPDAIARIETLMADDDLDPAIRRGLTRARSEFAAFGAATFDVLPVSGAPDVEEIQSTPDSLFYDCLPGWCARLSGGGNISPETLDLLLDRCLELGPRSSDIAVLMLAAQAGIEIQLASDDDRLDCYQTRMRRANMEWSVETMLRDLLSRITASSNDK